MKHKDSKIKTNTQICWFGVMVDDDTECVTIPKSEFLNLLWKHGDSRFMACHLYQNDSEVTIPRVVYEKLLKEDVELEDELAKVLVTELDKEISIQQSKLTETEKSEQVSNFKKMEDFIKNYNK